MAVQTQTLYDHVKRKKRTCECVKISCVMDLGYGKVLGLRAAVFY